MKLTLTLSEAVDIIRQHNNLPSNVEVDIVSNESRHRIYIERIHKEIGQSLRYWADQKIPAIKLFRVIVPGAGLVCAKHFIEDYASCMVHAQRYGVLPIAKDGSDLDWNRKTE